MHSPETWCRRPSSAKSTAAASPSTPVRVRAASAGTSSGNAVIGSPLTGFISNDHSIDNNAGITSVLQNFGNNSVVQASTTINITVSK